jgi:hypothetical protein
VAGFFFVKHPKEKREDPPTGGDEQSSLIFAPNPLKGAKIQIKIIQGIFFVKPYVEERYPPSGVY